MALIDLTEEETQVLEARGEDADPRAQDELGRRIWRRAKVLAEQTGKAVEIYAASSHGGYVMMVVEPS